MKIEEIEKIEEYIIENKFTEAFKLLRKSFKDLEDDELKDETITLWSKYDKYNKLSQKGIMGNFESELNSIRLAILRLKKLAKEQWNKSYDSPQSTDSNSSKISKKEQSALKIIYEEYFDNNDNKWADGERKREDDLVYGKYKISNGRYIIERVLDSGSMSTWQPDINIDVRKDFEIEAKFSFLTGTEKSSFGIEWGRSKDKASFWFTIKKSGKFNISHQFEEIKFPITTWTESNHIKKGNNANVLRIQKKEKSYIFYINSELVHISDFHNFYGSRLGFRVFNRTKISIEYLLVKN